MSNRIALAGNPNCGKTTMFNRLTGSSQRVGNWPGVTIDRKEGKLKGQDGIAVVDLPGIYSLSPYSPEEVVSRDFLLKDRPDAVVNIVDATNLERNLYLTTQILEVGIPVVIALNMIDVVRKEGIDIDKAELSKRLGCPVVETSALKGDGIEELVEEILAAAERGAGSYPRYSDGLESYLSKVSDVIKGHVPDESVRWYAAKFLERDEMALEAVPAEVAEEVEKIAAEMENEFDDEADSIVAGERYNYIGGVIAAAVKRDDRRGKETASDKIDKIITNRWLGLPIFAAVMFTIYYIAITTIGTLGSDWVNDVLFGEILIPGVDEWLTANDVNGVLAGLIVEGIVAGVGAVVGFLPQMLVLFVLLVILEECGYMARVAFVMDRVFRRFGLSGKSFIPILVGTGCGVPGIMATRAIEGSKERRITAMTTTFIPCSAKLPVIAMIAGALFFQSAWVALSVYFMGIFCILISGVILKKWHSMTGAPAPFIMELPPYHVPGIFTVIRSTLERGWAFCKKAGTFIMLACAIVWFLSAFDWGLTMVDDINDSMLADIGKSLKWIFVPLGWGDDWEFTIGTITGLAAKENVVGTFGILFGYAEPSEVGEEFWDIVAARFGPGSLGQLAGYSFLAFNMICAPCFAAIGAMKGELGSWRDTGKAVLYQCVLAYVISLIIFQFGSILLGGGFQIWLLLAAAALVGLVYMLTAKDPFKVIGRGLLRRPADE
ncbi:MAG: ferrous iron transport protein B [Candidatus Methanoplasma sp.]|jgi:ferrous iron transport protein B|nr:ferrous iron transport protein B [Candidatus Methanoplasma sp.]